MIKNRIFFVLFLISHNLYNKKREREKEFEMKEIDS